MDPQSRALALLEEVTEERVRGRLEEAAARVEGALRLLEGRRSARELRVEALEQKAWILLDLEQPAEALAVLEEALEAAPEGCGLRQGLEEHAASLAERLGEIERAIAHLGRAEALELRGAGGESLHGRWLTARRRALEAARSPAA